MGPSCNWSIGGKCATFSIKLHACFMHEGTLTDSDSQQCEATRATSPAVQKLSRFIKHRGHIPTECGLVSHFWLPELRLRAACCSRIQDPTECKHPPIGCSFCGCQSSLSPKISALCLTFPTNYLNEAAGSHAVLHLASGFVRCSS